MRVAIFTVAVVLGTVTVRAADSSRYFPPLSHSKKVESDSFREQWYSEQLAALGERSLCCANVAAPHVFRFTWLRTFHHPVAIRIEGDAKGSWTIHVRVTDGAGGYRPGKLIVDRSRAIGADKVEPLRKLLELGSPFWALPSVDEECFGFDGSQWIVEVRDGARYHYVDRWTPDKDQVHDLGLMFIKLSGTDFGEIY